MDGDNGENGDKHNGWGSSDAVGDSGTIGGGRLFRGPINLCSGRGGESGVNTLRSVLSGVRNFFTYSALVRECWGFQWVVMYLWGPALLHPGTLQNIPLLSIFDGEALGSLSCCCLVILCCDCRWLVRYLNCFPYDEQPSTRQQPDLPDFTVWELSKIRLKCMVFDSG